MRKLLMLSLLACLWSPHSTFGQQYQNPAPLIDSLMDFHLHADDFVSGGVVLVCTADSVLYQKGYGYADVDNQIPFDPQQTVVQLASVTKVITATAVLQLVEKGEIDLDKPVADYIGEGIIDNPYDTDFTTRHLLTHTAGLDDRSTLMYANSQEQIIPLEVYIENYLPGVVWGPGRFFNYSNHAFNLLAYLVQRVADQPFSEYIQQHIVIPLEMESSGLGYGPELVDKLMQRYNLKGNDRNETWLEVVPLSYTQLPGADDFKTTATDMEHFIQMYLNEGTFRGNEMLSPSTIETAFSPAFSYGESMYYKQGLGWRILDRKGLRCVYHEGDDKGIETALYLYPEENLGIFMAFNNQMGFDIKREIRDSLENRLLPVKPEPARAYENYTDLHLLEGEYHYMNDAQLNFEKIVYLFKDNAVRVSAEKDTLRIGHYSYLEYKPLLFEMIGGRGNAVFMKDDDGEVSYLSFGTSTYRKLHFLQNPQMHRQLLIAALISVLLCFLISLGYGIILKVRKADGAFDFHGWIQLSAFFVILFVAGFALSTNHIQIGEEVPWQLKGLMTFSIVIALSFLTGAYKVVQIFRHKIHPLFFRILWSVELLAIATFLCILVYYNFFGWHFY